MRLVLFLAFLSFRRQEELQKGVSLLLPGVGSSISSPRLTLKEIYCNLAFLLNHDQVPVWHFLPCYLNPITNRAG